MGVGWGSGRVGYGSGSSRAASAVSGMGALGKAEEERSY